MMGRNWLSVLVILRLITEPDNLREDVRRSELQSGGLALAEERPARADQYRVDIDVEHVNEAVLQQCRSEETVAEDEKIAPLLLLEFGHLRHDIAKNDGRIVPNVDEKMYFRIAVRRSAYGWPSFFPRHIFANTS